MMRREETSERSFMRSGACEVAPGGWGRPPGDNQAAAREGAGAERSFESL